VVFIVDRRPELKKRHLAQSPLIVCWEELINKFGEVYCDLFDCCVFRDWNLGCAGRIEKLVVEGWLSQRGRSFGRWRELKMRAEKWFQHASTPTRKTRDFSRDAPATVQATLSAVQGLLAEALNAGSGRESRTAREASYFTHIAFYSCIILHIMAPDPRRRNSQATSAEISLVHLKNCLVNLPSSLSSILVNVNTVRVPIPSL
jgi:hypothetical protein